MNFWTVAQALAGARVEVLRETGLLAQPPEADTDLVGQAGDAAEELDSMYPVFRLREGGHEAIVAAPTTRAVKLVVHDFEPGWGLHREARPSTAGGSRIRRRAP
ncbi:type 1 glutamine amidotransferase family protein [Nonomuraea angiospora]|uniref:hypothetical protein n=1 Tax=Nonomuraea angiospora TaxID=46172 RepID=UPI0029B6361B|nr:hypothetical protein [Nonomuraea angiospora]MDX3102492.1 hypothetical protein [Nonomuraea angiospora]